MLETVRGYRSFQAQRTEAVRNNKNIRSPRRNGSILKKGKTDEKAADEL